jgi:hypothetical protein
MINENLLDRPLWGAEAIGREAGILRDDGTVNRSRTFYLLERGELPGKKVGGRWVSSLRQLQRCLLNGEETAKQLRQQVADEAADKITSMPA